MTHDIEAINRKVQEFVQWQMKFDRGLNMLATKNTGGDPEAVPLQAVSCDSPATNIDDAMAAAKASGFFTNDFTIRWDAKQELFHYAGCELHGTPSAATLPLAICLAILHYRKKIAKSMVPMSEQNGFKLSPWLYEEAVA